MHLGIAINETWGFFNEIYADLGEHYRTNLFRYRSIRTPVYRKRINDYLFRRGFDTFMRNNDVVFFEWASDLLAVASHLPKTCGIVTRLHRYELYQWAHKINWDAVDKIILVSKAKEREFLERFPKQAAKTMVSRPSISLQKFTPQQKTFGGDIGILCHLTPRKRVYELVLAFSQLVGIDDRFHLHIAGEKDDSFLDYYEALTQLVEDLNLQEKVTFYGHVSNAWEWYHRIDVFVSNSYSEGFQVALMEAMASGCVCLSHRWNGVDEILPGQNLFYTSNELVDKLLMYTQMPAEALNLEKEHMRQLACQEFDIEYTKVQIRQAIEEVYSKVNVASGA